MKEIHDRIFLQWYGIDEIDRIEGEPLPEAVEVTWCVDQVFDTDIEYVRADREMQEIHEAHIAPLENIIAELRRENDRLRAELAKLKPSWDDAPEWAQWLAMDADGGWYWHEYKPTDNYGTFGSKGKMKYTINHDGNYYESLEQRPPEAS